MDIRLSPDVERIIRGKLAGGGYDSAADVVNEALRLLEQRDQVRRKIADGLESLGKGQGIEGSAAFAELKSRHDECKRKKRE